MRLWLFFIFLTCFSSFSQVEAIETIVQKGHIQPVSIIKWHPSGDFFATGSTDHSIILWDYNSGKQIRSLNHHTGKIIDMEFSSDGSLLLTSAADNVVSIAECITGNVLFSYKYNSINAYPMSVAFSPSEEHIFIGDNRDQFLQVNIKDHSTQKLKKGFSAQVNKFSWSKDQVSQLNIKNYKGVELINRTTKDTTFIDFDKPHDYRFNPEKEMVAVGSNKLKAAVFNSKDGTLIKSFEAENQCDGCKMKIAFSKDGEYFATFARDEGLIVYKTNNWKVVSKNSTLLEADKLYFSNNSEYVTIQEDESFSFININSGKALSNQVTDKDQVKSDLHPNKPIQLIANDVFGITSKGLNRNRTTKVFEGLLNDKKQQVGSLNYSSWYSRNIINHLKLKSAAVIDKSGRFLAIGKVDTSVVIQDLETGHFLPYFIHHSSPIFSITFHPNLPLLITGDAEGNMKLWNYQTRSLIWKFSPHVRYIFSSAFNSEGDELITSSWDGVVKHWSVKDIVRKTPELIDAIDFKNNTGFTVGFSPRDLYLAVGDVEQNMRLYESDTKSYLNKFKGHSRTISDFCFFEIEGSQRIATVSRDGWLKIWDFNTGTLLDKFSNDDRTAMLSITHLSDRNLLVLGNSDRKIYAYNYKTRKPEFSFIAHTSGVNWVKWNTSSDELLSRSVTGEIKHWKLYIDSAKLQYTLHVIERNEWLLMSPNGFFDGTSKAMQHINYVQGWKSLEIDLFFDKYYTPQLFDQLNADQELNERGLNQMMQSVPTFDLKMKTFQNDLITVNPDSTYQHNSNRLSLTIDYSSSSSNISSIAVFNNNKRSATFDFKTSPVFRGINKEKEIEVEIVPGTNNLKLELITDNELRSPSKSLTVEYDTLLGKRELFIVALGINKYENPSYDLNYAKADARSFVESLSNNADLLFENIYTLSLFNKDVNKENVLRSIDEFKTNMGPEDVFVFYYAGHGVMIPQPKNNESSFFLVMNDITNMYDKFSSVSSKGISGDELFNLAKNIPAQKQLFIIDACQSGGALKAGGFRGVEREKAIAKLARSSGTFFITASQEMEYANESSDLKHGVFTYAILELMNAENELSRTFSADAIISASELKSYVESRVPELSKKYKGSPQYPTGYSFGNDFPVVERKP